MSQLWNVTGAANWTLKTLGSVLDKNLYHPGTLGSKVLVNHDCLAKMSYISRVFFLI